MRGNLAKVPFVAVIYLSLLLFLDMFVPLTPFYREVSDLFVWNQTWLDHMWMLGFCLYVCILACICYNKIDKTGRKAFLHLLPFFIGLLWVMPMFESLMLGEASGLMTRWDMFMRLAHVGVGTILMLLLSMMLFTRRPVTDDNNNNSLPATKLKGVKGPRKFKRVKLLLIMCLALPFAFFLLYFVVGYLLAWRHEAFRDYYLRGYYGSGGTGFFYMFVTMLLGHIEYAGVALLRGLLLSVFTFLLMLRTWGRKRLFIVLNVMFYLAQALVFFIPTPLMNWEVRQIHMIATAAVLVAYAILSAFLLPICRNTGDAALENEPMPTAGSGRASGRRPMNTGRPISARR